MAERSLKVDVAPEMFEWARKRSGYTREALSKRFPKLDGWMSGADRPTLKQLERFARATRVPIGYFFLPQPPRERIPIPDFRTIAGGRRKEPSGNLLDTIYLCQQRQDWYREYALANDHAPIGFIGSARLTDDIVATANRMRSTVGLDVEQRREFRSWKDALRCFVEQVDEAGVLVMVSSVVGSDSRRKLDPDEFRGFALSDPVAPVVFVNGADTRAAQMFTLAHELAHLWLGESSLSDTRPDTLPTHRVERWCNAVAAEFLVPMENLRRLLRRGEPLREAVHRLARDFKVSTLVILRRLYDLQELTRSQFRAAYEAELARVRRLRRGAGGDFYGTTTMRVSRRFAAAVVSAVLEGRASFTEAARLLGFRKTETFRRLSQTLEVGA